MSTEKKKATAAYDVETLRGIQNSSASDLHFILDKLDSTKMNIDGLLSFIYIWADPISIIFNILWQYLKDKKFKDKAFEIMEAWRHMSSSLDMESTSDIKEFLLSDKDRSSYKQVMKDEEITEETLRLDLLGAFRSSLELMQDLLNDGGMKENAVPIMLVNSVVLYLETAYHFIHTSVVDLGNSLLLVCANNAALFAYFISPNWRNSPTITTANDFYSKFVKLWLDTGIDKGNNRGPAITLAREFAKFLPDNEDDIDTLGMIAHGDEQDFFFLLKKMAQFLELAAGV